MTVQNIPINIVNTSWLNPHVYKPDLLQTWLPSESEHPSSHQTLTRPSHNQRTQDKALPLPHGQFPMKHLQQIPYTVTVWGRYIVINFLQNTHNSHPIAHPWGQVMGCPLWVQRAIDAVSVIEVLYILYLGGFMQERRNSIAIALELRLSCTNPSIWIYWAHYNSSWL